MLARCESAGAKQSVDTHVNEAEEVQQGHCRDDVEVNLADQFSLGCTVKLDEGVACVCERIASDKHMFL